MNTISPPDGAPRDALRRFMVALSTDVYTALLREREERRKQGESVQGASLSTITQDALIQYLGVGGEEVVE